MPDVVTKLLISYYLEFKHSSYPFMEDAVERAKVNPFIDQTSFLQVTGQTNRHQLQQVRVAEFAAKGEEKANLQGKSEMKRRKALAYPVVLSIGQERWVFTGIYLSVNVFFTKILNFKRSGVGRDRKSCISDLGEKCNPRLTTPPRLIPLLPSLETPNPRAFPTCCAPALPGGDQPGAACSCSGGAGSSAPSLSLCCLPTSSCKEKRNSYQVLPAAFFPVLWLFTKNLVVLWCCLSLSGILI